MSVNKLIESVRLSLSNIDGVSDCALYEDQMQITVPGILLDVGEINHWSGQHAGEIPITLSMTAFVFVGCQNANASSLVRSLAIQVMTELLNAGSHGFENVECPRIERAERDPFDVTGETKNEDTVLCWGVRFSYNMLLRESSWGADGVKPQTLYLGQSPKIGADHVDDYIELKNDE